MLISQILTGGLALLYRGTSLIRNTHPPRIAEVPRHRTTVGSSGGGGPYEQDTPVERGGMEEKTEGGAGSGTGNGRGRTGLVSWVVVVYRGDSSLRTRSAPRKVLCF